MKLGVAISVIRQHANTPMYFILSNNGGRPTISITQRSLSPVRRRLTNISTSLSETLPCTDGRRTHRLSWSLRKEVC